MELQHQLRPFAERFEPRWCRREQLHLTLKFLGDVSTADIDELSRVTRDCAALRPFDAVLERVNVFPDARRARVLVVEVTPSDERLDELSRTLDERAARCGVERERRRFRPHLTLARFKSPGNAGFLLESAVLERAPLRLSVLALYQSTRSEYVPLASAVLAG